MQTPRSREELEAEILRLRAALRAAGVDAESLPSQPREGDAEHRRGHPRQEAAASLSAEHAGLQDDMVALRAGHAALVRSEARQRAISESAIDVALVVTDPSGRVTDWNAGAKQVMGWSAEEMLGHPAERIFTPEDRHAGFVEQEMRRALEDGRAADERWHLRKDGQRFWASGEMMPVYDGQGSHLGFLKILRDRTTEHLAGRQLEEVQERYRLVTKATNDAIWDWDLASNHVLWNEALQDAYGHAPETVEPTGEWWLAQIHPDDRSRVSESIHAVIDGSGTAWAEEYRFQRADGSFAEVIDRGHVARDAQGRPMRMIGAMLDRTRLRSAETALRVNEQRIRAILDSIDTAFAIVQVKFDADERPIDYCFLEANPAFERQAGVDLQGKWVTEFAPDLERFWFETYGHVAKTGEPANFENYAEAFGRWFDVRAVRIGEPADLQIAILFSDVTARRR